MGYTVISSEAPAYDHTGWSEHTGLTCHTTAMKWVDGLRPESLEFVKNDCLEAVKFYPESHKAGHYTDIAHYCSMRIKRESEKKA